MVGLPTVSRAAGWLLAAMLVVGSPARGLGQGAAAEGVSAEEARLLQALGSDARTSPFVYSTQVRDGRVVLSGRVGSASFHAAAMEVALATGIPFTDRLVIDTAELSRVPRPAVTVSPLWVSPYPLLGVPVMDPLFGLQPPVISYPAWWPLMSSRRVGENTPAAVAVPLAAPAPATVAAPAAVVPPAPPPMLARPVPAPPPPGNVDGEPPRLPPAAVPPPPPAPAPGASLSVLSRVQAALRSDPGLNAREIQVRNHGGRVTLSGEVASVSEAFEAFELARRVPGVVSVVDQLRYPVPPPDGPNPLLSVNRPEGLSAFLEDHLGRVLGEGARVRGVEVEGNALRVGIALAPSREASQVSAMVRSMPLLRGFALAVDFGVGVVGAR